MPPVVYPIGAHAFNRTSLELKLELWLGILGMRMSFNRTSLELKLPPFSEHSDSSVSFNRIQFGIETNFTRHKVMDVCTFNRTSLELKHAKLEKVLVHIHDF